LIRIAAFGDCHVGADTSGTLRAQLDGVDEQADLLLVAGDLTKCGTADEAKVFVDDMARVALPRVAVLGNHDYHADEVPQVVETLERGGVPVLEGETRVFAFDGCTVGIAGTKGFGGGFAGACASAFGEPEMKAYVEHTNLIAARLCEALRSLDTDVRIALLHYAPVESTLEGERREIYPFLGSYLLAEAIDAAGADLVLHGHAHGGTERGATAGGIPVRNVAQPVLRAAYKVFTLEARTTARV
jgi:Icc-related predicted phosphoesterase